MTNIPDGYGFVGPRARKTAQALLDAANALGEDQTLIQAQSNGYLAPESIVKEYEKGLGADAETPDTPSEGPSGPDDTWKNADIEKWAADNGVDLDGATKKADMLSAISAATKEE